jgi:serine phosphatase RsbU (regulator of sigma subunit)
VRAAAGLSAALLYEQRTVMSAALQRSLRPPQLPAITEFMSAARFRAADEHLEIGGDFYDLDVGDDDWLLSIGDVCGKGIDAALVTGRTRQSLRTAAHFDRSPQRVLSAVNAVAYRAKTASGTSVSDLFVTVACARLRTAPSGGLSVDLAVAGHHPPVIVRADGTVEQPDVRGIAIGLRPEVTYDAVSVTLAPGDGMVLFTDGIDEAHGHHGHYGLARLQAVVGEHAGLGAEVICEAVDQDVMDYLDGRPHDDMAVVAVTCPR